MQKLVDLTRVVAVYPTHCRQRLSMNDFVQINFTIGDFIKYMEVITSMPTENSDSAHDSLVANALSLNLIPTSRRPGSHSQAGISFHSFPA